jgi:flagellar hook protein FlgE
MAFSFNTSLSGLNANSNALNVVGNNIANANTVGFRNSTISFVDVFADSRGARLNGAGNPLQIGNGVQTGAVNTSFKQGNLNESDSPLQAAIQGNGFFVVKNPDGSSGYTRAGNFTVDKQGFLVAPSGGKVQGYLAQNGLIPPGAALTALQIPIGQTIAPQVTTQASFRMNLDAGAPSGSVFHAPVQVYDSRGTAHSLDLTFTRQPNGSFQMTATLDGNPVQSGGAAGSPIDFTFDANGTLVTPTSLTIVPDQSQLDGATLPSIAINMRETNADGSPGAFNITSYARPSSVASTTQDGFSAGELNTASVDPNGNIFGSFSNGQSRILGQYALATFNSSDGLQRLGGNMFTETLASGQANIGAPNSGGRGSVAGGYLEQSNVNITNEFVELIEAQRGFQANSRVINSLNQTFQDLLQIV